MILKTVYGPPPADRERIEATEPEAEDCIREEEPQQSIQPAFSGQKAGKG
jgi:hypothetical protein